MNLKILDIYFIGAIAILLWNQGHGVLDETKQKTMKKRRAQLFTKTISHSHQIDFLTTAATPDTNRT